MPAMATGKYGSGITILLLNWQHAFTPVEKIEKGETGFSYSKLVPQYAQA